MSDPYNATISAGISAEGPIGTFTCTLNIVAERGQHYLWLRYQELWFDTVAGATTFLCNATGPSAEDCQNAITLTITGPGVSDTVTLAGDGTTTPPADGGPAWVIIGNGNMVGFTGQLWGRTWARTIDVSSETLTSNATYQFQAINVSLNYTQSVYGTFMVGRSVQLLDPVLELMSGNQILTDPESLATLGTSISGVAADSASQVVIRIQAQTPGQTVTLSLINDQGAASSNPTQDGTLSAINGSRSSGPLQLTAASTNEGPMAFAVYQPPSDFSRGGNDDTAISRFVGVKWQLASAQGSNLPPITEATAITIWRPPVVLVHGLWGSWNDWALFEPFLTDSRFFITAGNYDIPPLFPITASNPSYPPQLLATTRNSALGFAYNAPTVLQEIQGAIVDFRTTLGVAATQADVVAHSMGGTITRTLENLPGFTGADSFGVGSVHKLITIGTPHLGSPLAADLLFGNSCTAGFLAENQNVSLATVTIQGVPGVSGGIGDLQPTSFALGQIQDPNGHEVPTALIAGTMTQANLGGLNCTLCVASYLRSVKCPSDFLASNLTASGWPTVFGGAPSDAVVPLASQWNGNSTGVQDPGVVHSSGIVLLNFNGPAELDPLGAVNTIQTSVIQLLNAPVQGSSFVKLP